MVISYITSIRKKYPIRIYRQLKDFLKAIYYFFVNLYILYYSRFVQKRYKRIILKIKKKDKFKVVFFLIQDSAWKYEGVYRLMEKDDRFEPIVVVCPYIVYGEETMRRDMNQAYNTFLTKDYNVIKTYNEATKKWLDVKKEIKPDIVFFTLPHKVTKDEYFITGFLDCLTCYVPYGFMIANLQQSQFNQFFHNLLWKGFYETPIHKVMAEEYSINKGENIVVTGSPMCDIFLDKKYIPKNEWKIKNNSVKKIIWAPHHTIEDNKEELAYSNFLTYHQFIFDLLKLYNGRIQIAFKPHPILKSKLYKLADWGIERTDAYYEKWQYINNGQLEEGSYEDLFLTSDAMIFDSISFMAEYIFTGKPSLFMVRDETIHSKFNEFGLMVFDLMYKSYKLEDLHNFIDQTVLNENDPLMNRRALFLEKYLIPVNKQTASSNILDNVLISIMQ